MNIRRIMAKNLMLFMLSSIIVVVFCQRDAYSVNWQITGYLPQSVSASKSYKTVTINGSFSGYREGRKVKIGTGDKTPYDLTSQIIVWTLGQVKVILPEDLPPGQYWLAVYSPDDQLLVKGPETFEVTKNLEIQMPGNKEAETKSPAELEIRKVIGLPSRICAGKSYPVSVVVANNGNGDASFYACAVGSAPLNCPKVPAYELKAGKTKVVHLSIRPDESFFSGGEWHGKIFLGKLKESTTIQLKGSPASAGSDCSVGVTTSWTSAPGMVVGMLFCDGDMRNHLVELNIRADKGCGKVKEFKKNMTIKKDKAGSGSRDIRIMKSNHGTRSIIPMKPREGTGR